MVTHTHRQIPSSHFVPSLFGFDPLSPPRDNLIRTRAKWSETPSCERTKQAANRSSKLQHSPCITNGAILGLCYLRWAERLRSTSGDADTDSKKGSWYAARGLSARRSSTAMGNARMIVSRWRDAIRSVGVAQWTMLECRSLVMLLSRCGFGTSTRVGLGV